MRPWMGCSSDSSDAIAAGSAPSAMQHAGDREQVVGVEAAEQRRGDAIAHAVGNELETDAVAVEVEVFPRGCPRPRGRRR